MPSPQTYSNHTRLDPKYHFVAAPLALLNLGLSIYYTIHQWPMHSRSHLWWIVMSLVLLLLIAITRSYALQNQDRTIRLEERLRYATLLSPAQLDAAFALTLRQVVALRFASDPELPTLIARAAAESLTPKQIKQAITTWRPDDHRI